MPKDQQCEWLDHKEAAAMMHRPPAYLRERNADGLSFKYWPEIERWQPGGRRTKLFVRRDHIEQWIKRSRTPAPEPIKQQFNSIGYESALPTLRRLGAKRTMRALGLK